MMTRKLPIIALATAPGKAGVGVIRISGPQLLPIATALFNKTLTPRQASLLTLRDAQGESIDQLLAIYFAAPASFTGEDVLELQCHGGPQLLELVMKRCLELGKDQGLVIAEPGEFSLRAYLNNKIDLAQAEAIADLIDAQSAAAVRGAARSLQGVFSNDINDLIEEITQLRILVESTLDFPEEEIDFISQGNVKKKIEAGQAFDVTVLNPPVLDALIRSGHVQADSRVVMGRIGLGAAIKSGAPRPDISTPQAFKIWMARPEKPHIGKLALPFMNRVMSLPLTSSSMRCWVSLMVFAPNGVDFEWGELSL